MEKGNAGTDSHSRWLEAPELSSLFQVKKLSQETQAVTVALSKTRRSQSPFKPTCTIIV